MLNMTDTKMIHEAFAKPPNGLTPLDPVLRSILQSKSIDKTAKQNLLILIATDE
jgi:hypothetical protein